MIITFLLQNILDIEITLLGIITSRYITLTGNQKELIQGLIILIGSHFLELLTNKVRILKLS